MKLVLAGMFPDSAKDRIVKSFPAAWTLRIAEPDELPGELGDAEVLIPEHVRVDAALLERAPKLRLIQTGAGYDNIDLAACTARGVQVCHAPGVNADAVAEHVLAFLLCWYKNIASLDRCMKDSPGGPIPAYTGAELAGKTIGVVGLGNVGRHVAALCGAFSMRVLGCARHPAELPGVTQTDLETLLRESDAVSLHVPLTPETRHLIDTAALARMKPDAVLINTARGAVVDEEALVRALSRGELGGACLDVFEEEPLRADHPLRALPNVLLTPHTAGFPDGLSFHKKRYAFFVRNIEAFFRGESPEGRLNRI